MAELLLPLLASSAGGCSPDARAAARRRSRSRSTSRRAARPSPPCRAACASLRGRGPPPCCGSCVPLYETTRRRARRRSTLRADGCGSRPRARRGRGRARLRPAAPPGTLCAAARRIHASSVTAARAPTRCTPRRARCELRGALRPVPRAARFASDVHRASRRSLVARRPSAAAAAAPSARRRAVPPPRGLLPSRCSSPSRCHAASRRHAVPQFRRSLAVPPPVPPASRSRRRNSRRRNSPPARPLAVAVPAALVRGPPSVGAIRSPVQSLAIPLRLVATLLRFRCDSLATRVATPLQFRRNSVFVAPTVGARHRNRALKTSGPSEPGAIPFSLPRQSAPGIATGRSRRRARSSRAAIRRNYRCPSFAAIRSSRFSFARRSLAPPPRRDSHSPQIRLSPLACRSYRRNSVFVAQFRSPVSPGGATRRAFPARRMRHRFMGPGPHRPGLYHRIRVAV